MYESPKIEELGTLEEMTSHNSNKPGFMCDAHCGHSGCNGS